MKPAENTASSKQQECEKTTNLLPDFLQKDIQKALQELEHLSKNLPQQQLLPKEEKQRELKRQYTSFLDQAGKELEKESKGLNQTVEAINKHTKQFPEHSGRTVGFGAGAVGFAVGTGLAVGAAPELLGLGVLATVGCAGASLWNAVEPYVKPCQTATPRQNMPKW
jgi:ElaB/YqjD/DUF883 family membrane-anchored ribosome-binding protein